MFRKAAIIILAVLMLVPLASCGKTQKTEKLAVSSNEQFFPRGMTSYKNEIYVLGSFRNDDKAEWHIEKLNREGLEFIAKLDDRYYVSICEDSGKFYLLAGSRTGESRSIVEFDNDFDLKNEYAIETQFEDGNLANDFAAVVKGIIYYNDGNVLRYLNTRSDERGVIDLPETYLKDLVKYGNKLLVLGANYDEHNTPMYLIDKYNVDTIYGIDLRLSNVTRQDSSFAAADYEKKEVLIVYHLTFVKLPLEDNESYTLYSAIGKNADRPTFGNAHIRAADDQGIYYYLAPDNYYFVSFDDFE